MGMLKQRWMQAGVVWCDGMGWDRMGGEEHEVKLFFSRGRYDAIERWRDLLGFFGVWERSESVVGFRS